MRSLDPRRFPTTITRLRRGPTTFNFFNEPVPGVVVETDLRASVQPISLEFELSEAGRGRQERLLALVPDGQIAGDTGATLRASPDVPDIDDHVNDRVRLDGVTYFVSDSKHWVGSHTEAELTRGD